MKLELRLTYSTWENYNTRSLQASTSSTLSDYEILVKTVTVEIPDIIDMTEKEFDDAQYMKRLSDAERKVEKKRRELNEAEEIVKNMLAISVEVSDKSEK